MESSSLFLYEEQLIKVGTPGRKVYYGDCILRAVSAFIVPLDIR
jgi:hypothetical protein